MSATDTVPGSFVDAARASPRDWLAVFGAMISYLLQALSFILLRLRLPHIHRPYVSPFGIPGSRTGSSVAASSTCALARESSFT